MELDRTPAEVAGKIENTIIDAVSNLLYYDRKEDFDLPVGAIEVAIRNKNITVDEIVSIFERELHKGLSYTK